MINPVRFMKAAARLALNARPPTPVVPRRIAGVFSTRNYKPTCSTLETLADLTDLTIVFDDDSTVPFPQDDPRVEVVRMNRRAPWNYMANLTTLMYRAFVHGCEWVVSIDDDLILSAGFAGKADVNAVIDQMESRRADVCYFRQREFRDSETQVRVDGLWSAKTFPVVRRNWFFYDGLSFQDPAQRFHHGCFPPSLRPRWFIHEQHRAYHLGTMTLAAREERVAKYRREDPDNALQADYTYLLDDTGMRVEPVPPADAAVIRRRYRPLPGA